jgi:hypothetical protein
MEGFRVIIHHAMIDTLGNFATYLTTELQSQTHSNLTKQLETN